MVPPQWLRILSNLLVPSIERLPLTLIWLSNLDLRGSIVFTITLHLFRDTIAPSVCMVPVLATSITSEGKEQKNNANFFSGELSWNRTLAGYFGNGNSHFVAILWRSFFLLGQSQVTALCHLVGSFGRPVSLCSGS